MRVDGCSRPLKHGRARIYSPGCSTNECAHGTTRQLMLLRVHGATEMIWCSQWLASAPDQTVLAVCRAWRDRGAGQLRRVQNRTMYSTVLVAECRGWYAIADKTTTAVRSVRRNRRALGLFFHPIA